MGNAATSPVDVEALGVGIGGALYVDQATHVFNVSSCRFQRNSAEVAGGAAMLSEFAANATTTMVASTFAVRTRSTPECSTAVLR